MQGAVAFVTLFMVLVNNDQAILLADRRISEKQTITLPDGLTREAHKPLNDEYNKLTVFTCRNARVGIGFTGVATKLTGFSTAKWLLEALMEAARPSPFLEPTVERLRQIATRDIGALHGDKQLTIVLAGYAYDSEAQPLGCLYSISNFEDPATKRRYPTQPEFKSNLRIQVRPGVEPLLMMDVYGATNALKSRDSQNDGAADRRLVEERRPARAIRDRALEALNRVGAPAGELGGIGKQCGSLIVPSDLSQPILTDYLSDINKWEVDFPSQVIMVGADTDGAVMGLSVRAVDPASATPMAVRKVPRNQPCPCGSGIKYKRCHGRVPPTPRSAPHT